MNDNSLHLMKKWQQRKEGKKRLLQNLNQQRHLKYINFGFKRSHQFTLIHLLPSVPLTYFPAFVNCNPGARTTID